jgi:hypothetical protein
LVFKYYNEGSKVSDFNKGKEVSSHGAYDAILHSAAIVSLFLALTALVPVASSIGSDAPPLSSSLFA